MQSWCPVPEIRGSLSGGSYFGDRTLITPADQCALPAAEERLSLREFLCGVRRAFHELLPIARLCALSIVVPPLPDGGRRSSHSRAPVPSGRGQRASSQAGAVLR